MGAPAQDGDIDKSVIRSSKYSNKELKDMCESLRTLVQGEPALRCSTTDDFLIRFIKASEYDVTQSFTLIKDYFRAKIENPDAYVVKSPKSKLSSLVRMDLGFPLLGRDYEGRRVVWVRLGDLDPNKESFERICDIIMIVLEFLSLEEDVQDLGASVILDATNFTLKIMKWCTPYKMKTIMRFLQDCIPMRFVAFHVVNAPFIFNAFFTAMKPFMREGFKSKLKWHKGDLESLYQHMDRKILPPHLGGDLNFKDMEQWYLPILEKEEIFEEFRQMGYINASQSPEDTY
ncbi:hypothetical protein M8J77_026455 [Diaphorina citri]|nr:hypothetical protein M8J77_026455 [Diaphorina citri]